MKKRVSIIIPTYNAETHIEALLCRLRLQSAENIEIIVIDSSSKDKTFKIAKKYADIVLSIPKVEFDHGKTRNIAGKLANGDIIIYLTQDTLPYDRNTINHLLNAFRSEEIAAAYGKQIPYKNTNPFGKHLRYFNYKDVFLIKSKNDIARIGIRAAFISNSFAAYRKSVLEDINWFKEGLIFGEDMYAGAKIILGGKKLAYVPKAKVYHSHSYTLFQEFQRYFDMGIFHKQENWILKELSKAESEGIKYVVSELKYLTKSKTPYLIPESILRNAAKYIGYKAGIHYNLFPRMLCKNMSINKTWWKNVE